MTMNYIAMIPLGLVLMLLGLLCFLVLKTIFFEVSPDYYKYRVQLIKEFQTNPTVNIEREDDTVAIYNIFMFDEWHQLWYWKSPDKDHITLHNNICVMTEYTRSVRDRLLLAKVNKAFHIFRKKMAFKEFLDENLIRNSN